MKNSTYLLTVIISLFSTVFAFYLIDAEAKIVERKGSSKGKRGFQFIVCF